MATVGSNLATFLQNFWKMWPSYWPCNFQFFLLKLAFVQKSHSPCRKKNIFEKQKNNKKWPSYWLMVAKLLTLQHVYIYTYISLVELNTGPRFGGLCVGTGPSHKLKMVHQFVPQKVFCWRRDRKWKRPQSLWKLYFLRWSSKSEKNGKCIFSRNCLTLFVSAKQQKRAFFVHTICCGQNLLGPKTVKTRKHYKSGGFSGNCLKPSMTLF